jgi:hypothetical protein
MTHEHIIAYLLAELPEEELERFEDECFAQENWPEQISLVEEDLIEAYLRRELTAERRRRFEDNYLITEARKERVIMSAALLRLLDEPIPTPQSQTGPQPIPPPQPAPTFVEQLRAFWSGRTWGLPHAAVALLLVAVIIGVWWIARSRPPQFVATLTLNISHKARGADAQANSIKLSDDTDALRIALTLPEQTTAAASYRVLLENVNGEGRSVEIVSQDARTISVVLPAAQLARGQHALKLFAVNPDGTKQRIPGSYYFIVE